jgi:short-subunit dehydrogenase
MTAKTILITGASSGIGAALAVRYAQPSTRLVLWGRNRQRLEQTAATCRAGGADVTIEDFDLSDVDRMTERLERADKASPLELAIFNAGLGGTIPKDRLTQSTASARQMIGVNLTAPVVGANLIAERMAARGHGHIVFIGSIAESFPLPMAPAYSATKAGLALFAEALRIRLAPRGGFVTLVSPGFVDTPMSRSVDEPRPFLITAEKAAKIVTRKIEARAASIVVPWQFAVLRTATAWLPRTLIRAVLART